MPQGDLRAAAKRIAAGGRKKPNPRGRQRLPLCPRGRRPFPIPKLAAQTLRTSGPLLRNAQLREPQCASDQPSALKPLRPPALNSLGRRTTALAFGCDRRNLNIEDTTPSKFKQRRRIDVAFFWQNEPNPLPPKTCRLRATNGTLFESDDGDEGWKLSKNIGVLQFGYT